MATSPASSASGRQRSDRGLRRRRCRYTAWQEPGPAPADDAVTAASRRPATRVAASREHRCQRLASGERTLTGVSPSAESLAEYMRGGSSVFRSHRCAVACRRRLAWPHTSSALPRRQHARADRRRSHGGYVRVGLWCGRAGGVGSIAVDAVHRRPDLELVGCVGAFVAGEGFTLDHGTEDRAERFAKAQDLQQDGIDGLRLRQQQRPELCGTFRSHQFCVPQEGDELVPGEGRREIGEVLAKSSARRPAMSDDDVVRHRKGLSKSCVLLTGIL